MSEDNGRILCKYGADCYQKNPVHLQKYKHPKKRPVAEEESGREHSKRQKECKEKANYEKEKSLNESTSRDRNEINEEILRRESNYTKDLILISKLPKDVKARIKAVFLVDMPDDFYSFFEFCKSLGNKNTKKEALISLGLELVGPFDVLEGEIKNCTKEDALRHYRYYYDPPEFQTVLKGNDKTGHHYGYFRDDPNELPCFVAGNEALVSCTITLIAGNLFATLNSHIERIKKTADPFKKMHIHKIQNALVKWCKKHNISLDNITDEIRKRKSRILAKTFHGAGIVVPYDKKTQVGYRELAEDEPTLRKILTTLCETKSETERTAYWAKLQPVITSANIANDEFDFGTSLELGLDLFSFGSYVLHKIVLQQLNTAYKLLNRELFSDIISAHLQNRLRGTKYLNTISVS